MNKKELNTFKKHFLTKKEELLNQQKNLFKEMEIPKGDQVDLTMEERDQALQLKLQGRDRFYLKKIEQALDKIEKGEFGQCEDCGNEISLKRLSARPTASMCIHCKEEQENEERSIAYSKKSHTLGKTILNSSVKKLELAGEKAGVSRIQVKQAVY